MENIKENNKHGYSTQKQPILFREYGRNVQMLASFVQKIEDKEERNKKAQTLVELMRNINPSLKDTGEYYQKIWDHLFLITGLELDVEAPYPKPEESVIMRGEPKPLNYNSNELLFRHYGRNTELLIKSAMEKEGEDQFKAIVYIGRLMKKFYSAWNGENVDNNVIAGHIKRMSQSKIVVDLEKINEKKLWDVGGNASFRSGASNTQQMKHKPSGGGVKKSNNYSNHSHSNGNNYSANKKKKSYTKK